MFRILVCYMGFILTFFYLCIFADDNSQANLTTCQLYCIKRFSQGKKQTSLQLFIMLVKLYRQSQAVENECYYIKMQDSTLTPSPLDYSYRIIIYFLSLGDCKRVLILFSLFHSEELVTLYISTAAYDTGTDLTTCIGIVTAAYNTGTFNCCKF